MNCVQCGTEIEVNDRFCIKCGKPVLEMEVAASLQQNTESIPLEKNAQENVQQMQSSASSKGQSENIDKARETAKSYWNFIVENLKAPTERGLNQKGNDFLYGYINIFILSLLFGLGTYFEIKSVTGGYSFLSRSVSFFETFFTVFIYVAIASLVIVGVVFGVLKKLLKVDVTFHQVLGRFGALITIPTVLSSVYFILALPGFTKIIALVSMLILSSLQIALILTFFSYRMQAKSKFDAIYGIIIAYVIFGIFIALTSDAFSKYFFGGLLKFGI